MTHFGRGLGVLLGAGALFAYGCGGGQPPAPAAEVAPPPAAKPAVAPAISINALMVGMVDHAAHDIWNAGNPETPPKTDNDWAEIEHHAMQIAAAGPAMALGGTGTTDAQWAADPAWAGFAQQLTNVGLEAMTAARNKNREAISRAGDQLLTACESCHDKFKGDLPTEGIVHPHMP